MTKMRRIILKFSKPLDEKLTYQGIPDVIQEEILFADVNGIRLKIAKELKKVLKSINVVRIINPVLFTALEYRVQGMDYTLNNMVDFRRIDDTTYHFIYPSDMTALLQIKGIGLKLGLLKIKDRDLQLVKVIREREICEAFEKFSFREMKLEPGSWTITTDEFDTDPAPNALEADSKPVLSEGSQSPSSSKEAPSEPQQPPQEGSNNPT